MKRIIMLFILFILAVSMATAVKWSTEIGTDVLTSSLKLTWWEKYITYRNYETAVVLSEEAGQLSSCKSVPDGDFNVLSKTYDHDTVLRLGSVCSENALVSVYRCNDGKQCNDRTKVSQGYKVDGVSPTFTQWAYLGNAYYYAHLCYSCDGGTTGGGGSTDTCTYNSVGLASGETICAANGLGVYRCNPNGAVAVEYSCDSGTSCTPNEISPTSCCNPTCSLGCNADGSCKVTQDGTCSTDIDCPAGEYCDSGTCSDIECTKPVYTTCNDGSKIIKKDCYNFKYIDINQDCPLGVPDLGGIGDPCKKDSECKANHYCKGADFISEGICDVTRDPDTGDPVDDGTSSEGTDYPTISSCVDKDEQYYAKGEIKIEDAGGIFTSDIKYNGDVRTQDLNILTEVNSFFGERYVFSGNPCCSGLKGSYDDTKNTQYEKSKAWAESYWSKASDNNWYSWLPFSPIIDTFTTDNGAVVIDLSYKVYTCQESGSSDFNFCEYVDTIPTWFGRDKNCGEGIAMGIGGIVGIIILFSLLPK